jgi:hypothetical protein
MATSRDIFALGGERQPVGGDPPHHRSVHLRTTMNIHGKDSISTTPLPQMLLDNLAAKGEVCNLISKGEPTLSVWAGGVPPRDHRQIFHNIGGRGEMAPQ